MGKKFTNKSDIETLFPNLKLDDSIISASESKAYNCIAYSGGLSSAWIDPELTSQYTKYLSPWYNEDNEKALDNFYGNNPPRYKGATTYEVTTNENESVINVYKLGDKWTHAAVKRPGNNNNSLKEEVYIAPSYETNMKTFIKLMLNSRSYKLIQSE